MSEAKINSRMCAYKILHKIEYESTFSNLALRDGLRNAGLSAADRRLVTTVVYGCVKYKRYLDYVIAKFSGVKLKKLSDSVLLLLRMGAYQILMLERVPDSAAVNETVKLAAKLCYKSKAFVNAVLRKISLSGRDVEMPEDKIEGLGVLRSYPNEIVKLWFDELGEAMTARLLKAGNERAPLTVRTNMLRITTAELEERLQSEGVSARRLAENMLVLEGTADIASLEAYKKGLFTPQGVGSYLTGLVLAPRSGQTVLDLCAAPGGKSTHMAELMNNEGKIFSFDLYEHKTELIAAGARRLGLDIITAKAQDSSVPKEELFEGADAVLADVPCSGLGIIHKKPDIKWSFDAAAQNELAELQYKILEAGSKYVKRGGVLVYSTCTISQKENMDNAERFLREHGDFELCGFEEVLPDFCKKESARRGYVQFYPTDEGMDGFFICKMKRKE